MILLSIFTTTEFYVTMLVIAASIVAYSAIPHGTGPVRELLVGSQLIPASPAAPSVSVEVDDTGAIQLLRGGLVGVDAATDAVSLAIEIRGTDVVITERIVGGDSDACSASALFRIDSLAPLHHHFRYVSPSTQLSATFAFTPRPGLRYSRALVK